MRKFLSFAFVLVMVLALAIPAMAAGELFIDIPAEEDTGFMRLSAMSSPIDIAPDKPGFTLENRGVNYEDSTFVVRIQYNNSGSGNTNGGGKLSWVGETKDITHVSTSALFGSGNTKYHDVTFKFEQECIDQDISFKFEAKNGQGAINGTASITVTINGLGHGDTYNDVTLAAICVETGLKDVYCEVCDRMLEKDVEIAIDPNNHVGDTYEDVITAATCIAVGEMGTYCEDCDALLASDVIDALGHDWGEVVKEVTCLEDGCIYIVCNRDDCNEWYYKEDSIVEKLGHNFVFSHTKPMTCTEDGVDFGICANCGDWAYISEIIPASCNWNNGVVENGKIIFTCLDCGKTRSEDIPAPTLTGVTAPKFISIIETSKNSRVWTLSFEAKETYSDGSTKSALCSVDLIGNNANLSGKIDLGNGYTLIYDIKGNGSNIKDFKIVKN